MSLGIGIDTGGTYTDAVIYDYGLHRVLAKGKSLTTKENLALGIGGALDSLPFDLLKKAKIIALSTTLATNACVENKGGRAKLVLIGSSRKILDWIDSKNTYGLKPEDVLCVDAKGSLNGKIVAAPDWENVIMAEKEWFTDAQAISIAEVYAMHNGAACEKAAKEKIGEHFAVPIVMASELVSGLNVMERGTTALLNARLLPVIEEFMKAVSEAMRLRELSIPAMIVRSDGSLMVDKLSRMRPVETILSGPASSIIGGRGIAHSENCLIIDMGGTTTDISIVKDNMPAMTGGIRIGGWRTQIKGVFIDTFGLGGDSRIIIKQNDFELCDRRVQPLCVAAAQCPEIKASLEVLLSSDKFHEYPLYEFLYIVRKPRDTDIARYNSLETALLKELSDGPIMLGSERLDIYSLKSERLEDEGIVMRCGLTPTDIMHIKGDFTLHNNEASILAARYFLNVLPQYDDDKKGLAAFCNDVYDKVCKKLYENIVRVLIANKHTNIATNGLDEQLCYLISNSWSKRNEQQENNFMKIDFSTSATLIGIGAPTHIFLPEVAKALKTNCIIPEHSEVANAIGAITADISAKTEVKIAPCHSTGGIIGYTAFSEDGSATFKHLEEAIEDGKKTAKQIAIKEATARGAIGELFVKVDVSSDVGFAKEGGQVDLGTTVIAVASGRIGT